VSCVENTEVIAQLSPEEEAWLREQLQDIYVYGDEEYPEEAVPDEMDDQDPDWRGARFLRDNPEYDPDDECRGFEYDFSTDEDADGWGRHLWIYIEEWGNADNVAWLVQKFLRRFRPDQCWSLTYATTCSKPRCGEFGGGAVFVTADEIKWQNAHGFIGEQQAAFKSKGTV
jgi:hypothetical protein